MLTNSILPVQDCPLASSYSVHHVQMEVERSLNLLLHRLATPLTACQQQLLELTTKKT